MKKKIIILVLITSMCLASFTTNAFALGSFSDINDTNTASTAEVLRIMGVIDGVGDGKFDPEGSLTRAQFCKMAVCALFDESEFTKYSGMTIFPDVKSSAWFAKYVNYSAKKELVNGFPDGKFHPGDEIPIGQAVTILLRLIGYTDDIVGGVWPYSQMQYAKSIGMLNGLEFDSSSTKITRAEATILFVNTILVDANNNKRAFSLSNETTLKSINIASKKMKTSSGEYEMAKSIASSYFLGKTGYVVLNKENKAISFIPNAIAKQNESVNCIITSNGNKTAIDKVAGRVDYKLIKNGVEISADKLKLGDVISYSSGDNIAVVCDTRLTVYVEDVYPNPANPTKITCLGGKTFDVLPLASEGDLYAKAGMYISLHFSAEGKVAAFGSPNFSSDENNAIFVVNGAGKAKLLCGTEIIDIGDLVVANPLVKNNVAKLGYASADYQSFYMMTEEYYGSLSINNATLGSKKIASGVIVFCNGELTTLDNLNNAKVRYARTNPNGEIDVLVVTDPFVTSTVYGIGTVENVEGSCMLTISNAKGDESLEIESAPAGSRGYVAAEYGGYGFQNLRTLKRLGVASKEDFVNDHLLILDDLGHEIAKDVQCFNADTDKWTSLEDAIEYGRYFAAYVDGDAVCIVEYWY